MGGVPAAVVVGRSLRPPAIPPPRRRWTARARPGGSAPAADWLLDRIEVARGARFEHRTLLFFGLMLGLALITSTVLGRVLQN